MKKKKKLNEHMYVYVRVFAYDSKDILSPDLIYQKMSSYQSVHCLFS